MRPVTIPLTLANGHSPPFTELSQHMDDIRLQSAHPEVQQSAARDARASPFTLPPTRSSLVEAVTVALGLRLLDLL